MQSILIFVLMGTVLLVSGLQVMGAIGLAIILATIGFVVGGTSEKAGDIRPGNAVPISRARAPGLYAILEELTARFGAAENRQYRQVDTSSGASGTQKTRVVGVPVTPGDLTAR